MWFTIGLISMVVTVALILGLSRAAVWLVERRDRRRKDRQRTRPAIMQ